MKPVIKIKPCLRCDKPIKTTPEWRLCSSCRGTVKYYGIDTGYSSRPMYQPGRRKGAA